MHELAVARDDVLDAARRVIDQAPPRGVLFASFPAQLCDVAALLEAMPSETTWSWRPPQGPAMTGLGVALRIPVDGDLRAVAERGRDAFRGVIWRGERVGSGPRFFGGARFALASAARDAHWRELGGGLFVLPRLRYERQGRRAYVSLALARHDRASRDAAIEELAALLAAIARAHRRPAPGLVTRPVIPAGTEGPPSAEFEALFTAAMREIDAGRQEKIVVARRVMEERPREPASAILSALSRAHPSCFAYAMRVGEATFLGATPERLVRKVDHDIDAEALAGTAPSPCDEAALLASAKDDREHAVVVRAIALALATRATDVQILPRAVRALANVSHLVTPIRARSTAHVLELAAALHPTPAVAGAPRASASAFLAAHETFDRGWYAGPIGWFDARGDGEIAVALRAALVTRHALHAFAGAGLVQGSDLAHEWREIEAKLGAVRGALARRSP